MTRAAKRSAATGSGRLPRKLAEIWEVKDGYHLRVEVGAFQRTELGISDVPEAENAALYEAVEVCRQIVRNADAQRLLVATDARLRPDG